MDSIKIVSFDEEQKEVLEHFQKIEMAPETASRVMTTLSKTEPGDRFLITLVHRGRSVPFACENFDVVELLKAVNSKPRGPRTKKEEA